MAIELTEALLSQAAGWDVVKMAKAYLEQGKVLSSFWEPPLLRGVVQAGDMSFRASMVITNHIDIENLCNCPEARRWGKICAHGVAVGLHWIKNSRPLTAPPSTAPSGLPKNPPGRAPVAAPAPVRKVSSLRRDPEGEPAELYIILPPNFDQAAARGKIMLMLEAKWDGGRNPLNALPKDRAFAFSALDLKLIEQLEVLTNGETPAVLQLSTLEFTALLPTLTGNPRVTLGKAQAVMVTAMPWIPALRATLETNGEITLAVRGQGKMPVPLGEWVWQDNQLAPMNLSPALKEVMEKPTRLARAQVPQFLGQQWPQMQAAGTVEANFKLEDFTLEPQSPRLLLHLKGGTIQLTALLQCAYGPRILTLGVSDTAESVWLPDPAVPTRYSTRDLAAERAAVARLVRNGFSSPDSQGKLVLNGQTGVLNFFAREFSKLQREWKVTMEEQLQNRTLPSIERMEPQFQITSSGMEWFNLGVVFASSSGETFSAADVQRLLLSGQNHTRLKNGRLAVIDSIALEDLQEVLQDCSPQQDGQGYRINNAQAGFLEATLKQHGDWKVQAPAAWRDRAARQSGEMKLECPPLGDLDIVLRPYQKHGVGWLYFLRENKFGGILADEMGLGKTLQTLAFLRSVRERGRSAPVSAGPGAARGHTFDSEIPATHPSRSAAAGPEDTAALRGGAKASPASASATEPPLPMLIVCPTSLVYNWVAETKKFTPTLKVLALHGPDRHPRFAEVAESDLVVTSYALIRRDAERYRAFEFDTVVLDEAQHIKNRQTQNAQAVKAIRARQRLVLTGTPMENSVLDLWSIFDFLMPGYLGTAKDFRERYELPIAKEKNAEAQARLARRLRPFMLRRLKKEVAADLPEKLELISFCELTAEQRGVYQQVIEASRKEVLAAVGEQGLAKSRMLVLTALLRLRQTCCDLRLLKTEGVNPATASGKLDLFSELLEEVIDGGHRVLVFSQFVGMLGLLKERLAEEGIAYSYLDGSTTNRGAVVEQFQKDATIPVFLISLKAGGVGLNLTGADTVIHFDPWWNPAVEDQATDRAHRIGQTRVVTSYKLITRDTVEEKILTLQNRKREIIQATIGGEAEFAETLSWEEIQELLA
jgi:superfamily II DNA or RNA helicase